MLMVLAATVAALSVYFALAETDEVQRVAVARSAVTSGTRLADIEVDFTSIELREAGALEHLLTADELGAYADFLVKERLEPGELLSVLDLHDPQLPDGLRSMSLPVPPERSAGGTVRVGDRVDVISVAAGVAIYVARDLEVLAVPGVDGGALDEQAEAAVTVAVDDATALQLAAALEAGPVHVLRATGAVSAKPLAAVPVPGADQSTAYIGLAEQADGAEQPSTHPPSTPGELATETEAQP